MKAIIQKLNEQISGAPLVLFRVAFGVMMALSIVRFWAMGWIEQLYIKPSFFFTYYGFEWIKPLPANGMYAVFALMFVSAVFIAAGFAYRFASVAFFLLFTYIELIDKTTYLNHYYFISIIALLLCFLPAHKMFSLDVKLGITKSEPTLPRWMVLSIQLQMAMVYCFAGIAKINHDWLIEALPLRIWLPAKNDTPLIGFLLNETWVAYLFSWCGMLFDTLIPFFLFWRRTTYWAYALVVVFHVLTAILFPGIGMFPFIMIVCATVFLPSEFHQRMLKAIGLTYNAPFDKLRETTPAIVSLSLSKRFTSLIPYIFLIHFSLQLLLPFRFVFYPEKLFWHEEGYRFSWRVMLLEKAGMATFHVKYAAMNQILEIRNADYLTAQQEKQMSTQPDMLLQFAKHLAWVHEKQGLKNPEVYVESYVTLNGKGSRQFIRNDINLAAQNDGFAHKDWILPYNFKDDKMMVEL
jgi:hypothetical protein